ncbi:MAG: DNA-3-methyladenine glycosylase [Chloroflexi bacterium]|nr:DNA-3-methyladenine glycosylase [Chloroflexota bacterium]
MNTRAWTPIPRSFYDRPTVQVAQELLGHYLVREYEGQLLVGRIVETEAYVGLDDKASHASVGRTARNAVMFGPPGYAYVYLIYGVHHCLNVVTERPGYPAAVLIRALEPVEGVEVMRRLRGGRADRELTNGPGKLCQALAIDLRFNGHDLCLGRELWVAQGESVPPEEIVRGPRVGVRGDERALTVPWRFAIRGNPYVSRGR